MEILAENLPTNLHIDLQTSGSLFYGIYSQKHINKEALSGNARYNRFGIVTTTYDTNKKKARTSRSA